MIPNTTGTTAVFADAEGEFFHAPIAAWGKYDDQPNQMLTVAYLPAGQALVHVETYEECSHSEFVGFGDSHGALLTRTQQALFLDAEMDTLIHEGSAFKVDEVDRSSADFSGVVRVSGTPVGGKRGQVRIEFSEKDAVTVVRA